MNYSNLKDQRGFSIVSAMVGLSLIMVATYYFISSQQDFQKSVKKGQQKVDDKKFVVSHAIIFQKMSFDELLLIAKNIPSVECSENPIDVTTHPVLNSMNRWLPNDQSTEYCLTISRSDQHSKKRILDIELTAKVRKINIKTQVTESKTHFRKAK